MKWTLKQLSGAVNGILMGQSPCPDVGFETVVTDSRQPLSQACYVALQGQNFDGHDFIAQAIEQGAMVLLVSKPELTAVPAVLVEDTRIALGQFAAWHRQQCPLKKLVAVTGSNGKTTVKTMLHSVLSHWGATLATEGNLNNDFGVPRTLLAMESNHSYAVIEMGANHPGEIRYLTNLAQPDIALITQASEAHLEGFGSLQGVIDTKGEIFEGLKPGGTAVINLDSPGAAQWLAQCKNGRHAQITFGRDAQADVKLLAVKQTDSALDIELQLPDGVLVNFVLPVLGPHNAMNAAATIAAAWVAGLNWGQILPGLVNFKPILGRLNTFYLKQGVLIDDTYNANPTSVKAGIDTLVALEGERLICLGSMAELGPNSVAAHQAVLDYALQQGVSHVFVMGKGYEACVLNPSKVRWFATHLLMVEAVQAKLDGVTAKGRLNILVKGSRSAGMEAVSQPLISLNPMTPNV